MKAILKENAQSFVEIVKGMQPVLSEKPAPWFFSPDGLNIRGADVSGVVAVDHKFPPEWFSEYECNGEEYILGIPMDKKATFVGIMNFWKPETTITLNCENTEILTVVFQNKKGTRIKTFRISLLNVPEELLDKIPNYEWRFIVRFPQIKLYTEFKNFDGDPLDLEVTKTQVSLKRVGGDSRSGHVVFAATNSKSESVDNIVITLGTESKEDSKPYLMRFSSPCIAKFLRIQLIGLPMNLYLADNAPLLIQFDHSTGATLKYYVAPRVDAPEPSETETETAISTEEEGKERVKEPTSPHVTKKKPFSKKRKIVIEDE
jgi:hypothetical protein